MEQVVIENPVINVPFVEPGRHFRFTDDGMRKKDKAVKVETARTLWVPAVNNHGGFGRWAFLEVTDPWDAKNTIRAYVGSLAEAEAPSLR